LTGDASLSPVIAYRKIVQRSTSRRLPFCATKYERRRQQAI
jgi:hypothetical protein